MASIDLENFKDDSVLTDSHIITTTVTGSDGTQLTSSLDLNTVLGNVNGVFSWGGTNFSNGAQNVVVTEGCQLEADLPDNTGALVHALMYIGSSMALDSTGKPAIQHAVGTVHSAAHATASTNEDADATVTSQAQTLSDSSQIQSVTTIKGDASKYWPDDNAPAAGHGHSKVVHTVFESIHLAMSMIECFL